MATGYRGDRCAWSGKRARIMSEAERDLCRSRVAAVCPGCGQTVTVSRWGSIGRAGEPLGYMVLSPHAAAGKAGAS